MNSSVLGWALACAVGGCDLDTVAPTRDAGVELDGSAEEAKLGPVEDAQALAVDAGALIIEPPLPCDLTGSWIVTLRQRINALGAQQVSRGWHYLEIAQAGSAITVTKGVLCGTETVGIAPITVTVDDSPSWPAYHTHPDASYTGMTGTSMVDGDGCTVTFDSKVLTKGLSAGTYLDRSVPMPTATQQAAAGAPGWEDWDADGHPGITQHISGTLTGSLYVAIRFVTTFAGTIASTTGPFQLPLSWSLDQSTMGVDGSPLLAVQGSPESDPTGQFAEFARLPSQYIVDDIDTTCDNVHTLTTSLTPDALQ